MNGKSINFDNKNIKKSDFYNKNKKIFNVDDIDANKALVSMVMMMIYINTKIKTCKYSINTNIYNKTGFK